MDKASGSALYSLADNLRARITMPEIMQFVPILIVSFAGSLALTPLSRQIAMRLGVVDKPNQRKIHIDHKPMMGGLAVCMALFIALLLFSPPRHIQELAVVLVGAVVLAIMGLIDDRYDLSWRSKTIVQLLAGFSIALTGIRMHLTGIPAVDILVTVFWVFAITNATNYLDNMDGQSAGMTAIAAFFFVLIALMNGLSLVSLLAAAVLGSALGFLVHNFNPASTFMGDMGALPLGFILSVLAIKLQFDQPFSLQWLIPVFILALPVLDVNLVTWTRIFEGRSPTQAGKDHTSHRLMSMGLKQRPTLLLIYSFCAIFGFIAVLATLTPAEIAMRLYVLGLGMMLMYAIIMVWLRQHYQKPPSQQSAPDSDPIKNVQAK